MRMQTHTCDTLLQRDMTSIETQPETLQGVERRRVPWRVSDAMIGVGIVACGGIASVLALAALQDGRDPQGGAGTLFALLTLHILMVATVWLFAIKKRGARWENLGIRIDGLRWPAIVGWAALGLMVSLASTAAYVVIVTATGIEWLLPQSPLTDDLLGQGPTRALSVGVLVALGPAAEEVFFRGFLLAPLVQGIGAVPGVAAASAVFAVAHGDIAVVLPVFVSGVILSWLYVRTGSLWPSFLAHSAQNSLAVAFVA